MKGERSINMCWKDRSHSACKLAGTQARQTRKCGAYTLMDLLVTITIIGILSACILPIISRGMRAAKRFQCQSNLKQIGMAFRAFSKDHEDRLPWQLTDEQKRAEFGERYFWEPNVVFSAPRMKIELDDPRLLASPCDPVREQVNQTTEDRWRGHTPRNPMPAKAISYLLCEGGDTSMPKTILALTRNISTDDLKTARWVGSSEGRRESMGLLGKNKGQILLADGSVVKSSNSDLKGRGPVVKRHLQSTGGLGFEAPSTHVMGWSDSSKVILAQSFFQLPYSTFGSPSHVPINRKFDNWLRYHADAAQKNRHREVVQNLIKLYMQRNTSRTVAAEYAYNLIRSHQYRRKYISYIVAEQLPQGHVPGI